MSVITVLRSALPCAENIARQIAGVYVEAFAGPPWFESWDPDQVLADFTTEMSRPGALCLVAQEEVIVGFCWGYSVTLGANLDEHLQAPGLSTTLHHKTYFYLDECAVLPTLHGRGVGGALLDRLLREVQGEIILRTKEGSPMERLIKKKGGMTIMHISESRIIMRFR